MVRGEWYAHFGSNGGGESYNLFKFKLSPPYLVACSFLWLLDHSCAPPGGGPEGPGGGPRHPSWRGASIREGSLNGPIKGIYHNGRSIIIMRVDNSIAFCHPNREYGDDDAEGGVADC